MNFGHRKQAWTVTLRIPRMREANIILIHELMCEEQHMHNERVLNI